MQRLQAKKCLLLIINLLFCLSITISKENNTFHYNNKNSRNTQYEIEEEEEEKEEEKEKEEDTEEETKEKEPNPKLFSYLKHKEALECGKYYSNPCFIIFIILFTAFLVGLIYVIIFDKDQLVASNILDNIQLEILKQNKFTYTKEELSKELEELNKFLNQDELQKEIQSPQDDNVPNDIFSIYLNKGPSISHRSKFFEQTTIPCPPRKKNAEFNEDRRGKYIYEENDHKRYIVQEYKPNNNLIKNENPLYNVEFNYSDEFSNEENGKDDVKIPKKEMKEHFRDFEDNQYSKRKRHKRVIRDIEFHLDKVSEDSHKEERKIDYFQKYASKMLIIKKNNNFSVDDRKKRIPKGKRSKQLKKINTIYEDINQKAIHWKIFLKLILLERNIYLSPFSYFSTLNQRWKRLILLYTYILLQYWLLIILLSLIENTKLNTAGRILIFSWLNILLCNFIIMLVILLFVLTKDEKKVLYNALLKGKQIKLITEWKKIKGKRRVKFYIGIIFFIIIFLMAYFFSFLYCSILSNRRVTFLVSFFLGIILDLFLFETLMILLLAYIYYKNMNQMLNYKNYFEFFFSWRCFRNCI